MAAVAMMTVVSAQAQRIEVVDADGHGIPLVSVLTEDGVLIGTTNLDGVLSDVKGAAKVALTHVAYKPQLVTVADLPSFGGTEGGATNHNGCRGLRAGRGGCQAQALRFH